MGSNSTSIPSVAELRSLASAQGVHPTDDDLERVRGFLATVLPTLRTLEEGTGREIPPAGLYLPDPEPS